MDEHTLDSIVENDGLLSAKCECGWESEQAKTKAKVGWEHLKHKVKENG